jgi:tRNA G18 (ribose-2'-O)-methylase SpoU
MGHALRIPFARAGSAPDHIATLRRAGFTVCALALRDDAQSLDDCARARSRPERIAILLGAEGRGLTDDAINAADVVLKIPMAEGVDSLNVAQAAAVACHALQPPAEEGRGEG